MSHQGRYSESVSQMASVTAVSEPAFPTVYRREKESATAAELNHARPDGSVSMFSAPAGETLLSQERQRDKPERLAPIPENRRLGYLSVAALIINKMIGMPPASSTRTGLMSLIRQELEFFRHPAMSSRVRVAAKARHCYYGFLALSVH